MLYETISKDMVNAMKSKDKDSLNTLRLLKSAIDLYLVNNKLDRKKMGKQSRINSETYSSKYFAERVLSVYKESYIKGIYLSTDEK